MDFIVLLILNAFIILGYSPVELLNHALAPTIPPAEYLLTEQVFPSEIQLIISDPGPTLPATPPELKAELILFPLDNTLSIVPLLNTPMIPPAD